MKIEPHLATILDYLIAGHSLHMENGEIVATPIVGGLTERQYECLRFIEACIEENRVPPSYDEIRIALGLASKSNVHRIVSALVERGFLDLKPYVARGISLLRKAV